MKVSEYMTRFPHTLGPEHSLIAAHRLMQRHGVRHLPVLQEGKLLGIVSQRDLYFLESLTDSRVGEMQVSEAMASDVSVVPPDATIFEVAHRMTSERIGSVVVVDHEKVVGIFTTIDALRALMELAEGSQPVVHASV